MLLKAKKSHKSFLYLRKKCNFFKENTD